MGYVSKGYDTIAFDAKSCDGCGDCMTACAKAKTGTEDKARSRIQILEGAGGAELALCRQCGDPKCVANCPAAALTKNGEDGVIAWDADKCVDCLLCTVGCVYGGIAPDPQTMRVAKCDMCVGAEGPDPACVKACPHGALELKKAGRIYNRFGAEEDLFVPGLAACQGCNSELLIRHTMRKIGKNSVIAAPPGCIPGMGTVGYNGKTGCKVPIFHPLLTNTAAMLAGLKRFYDRKGRDVQMVALAGDGGTSDCGFQSVSGAAERGEKILYVCVDNEGYMNTGMQRSSATSYGSWTSTTPVGEHLKGKSRDAKNLPLIMVGHRCDYVATASLAFMEDYYEKLERAIEASKEGFAYLHVYAPCPTGWRFPSSATIEVCRKMVETNFITLWEFTPKAGLRFTRPVENPAPLADYVKMMGKYRHLDAGQVAHIEAQVTEQVENLKRIATSG